MEIQERNVCMKAACSTVSYKEQEIRYWKDECGPYKYCEGSSIARMKERHGDIIFARME